MSALVNAPTAAAAVAAAAPATAAAAAAAAAAASYTVLLAAEDAGQRKGRAAGGRFRVESFIQREIRMKKKIVRVVSHNWLKRRVEFLILFPTGERDG